MATGISTENIMVAMILTAMEATLQWQQAGKEKTAEEVAQFYKVVYEGIRGATAYHPTPPSTSPPSSES